MLVQNMDILLKMGKHTGITAELGIPNTHHYVPIAKRSPVTSQVIIGTAGTVNKLIAGKKLDTSGLKILMYDDADHMLIEGCYKEDCVRIMKDIHKQSLGCKVLLYATIFNDRVKAFESKIVDVLKVECTRLIVNKDGVDLDRVKQYKVNVPDEVSKITFFIDKILELGNFCQTIIFVRTKESARMLHKALLDATHNATNFHGARTQEDKDSILKEYKDGLTQHLITTDVHARGFDPAQANLVINYDLPIASDSSDDDCELYLHRIGRVGRHRNKGAVFNFMCGAVDNNLMEKFEKYNKNNIVEVPFEISDEEFEDILAGR
ncbi:DEAD-box ATP-dependent RNA helicase 38 [Tanacetum coccineum]|uniref:DEAD-box ATP-dependent RNA helicase 38 n=1 Tax=Tanacetum coccineum TaxID=301880 RepID=A0ABQ5AUB7_9ASTR